VLPPAAPRYLGDIAISYERVVAQAAEYGHSPARELAYLTAHGVLHLLGYDHERGPEDAAAMRAREEAAMERLGLRRE
jgi:probable rRNA maturation factor